MSTLLIIDDEESVRYSFRYVLEDDDIEVFTAATVAEGLALATEHKPDVILLDLQLPDGSGLDLFGKLRKLDAKRPVIFVTAHGTTETAIEAMKEGAFDYLVKPVDLERLSQLLSRAFEASRLMNVPVPLTAEEPVDRIVGCTAVMQEMCKAIGRIAPQEVPVLILGESGTGKELVARALYHHSRRSDRPFLAINCAAIPDALLESELFGHERGAFTGADRRRVGKFEQCDGGTLFLDEIGDMALPLQAKMLRVLQDQHFERLGGNETVQAHVRILAATNQNLENLVAEGRFRKDLYYRLKGVTIQIPPLRDHREDVSELAHYFLFRFNRELGKDLRAIAPETLEGLQRHGWPGNVRELQQAIRVGMINASGHILLPEFLPHDLLQETGPSEIGHVTVTSQIQDRFSHLLVDGKGNVYQRAVEELERGLFPRVLEHTHWNQTQASELLGMTRGTLRQRLRSLGLSLERVITHDADPGDSEN